MRSFDSVCVCARACVCAFACACVCMHVCARVCVCMNACASAVHVCTRVHMCARVCAHACARTHVHVCVCVHVCVVCLCVCLCVSMCMCVCVCMCACMWACVRVCAHVCVRVTVCTCKCVHTCDCIPRVVLCDQHHSTRAVIPWPGPCVALFPSQARPSAWPRALAATPPVSATPLSSRPSVQGSGPGVWSSAFLTALSPGHAALTLLGTTFPPCDDPPTALLLRALVSRPDAGPCSAATTRSSDPGSESSRPAPGARGLVFGSFAHRSLRLMEDKCPTVPQTGTGSDDEATEQTGPRRGLRGLGDLGSETTPKAAMCLADGASFLGGALSSFSACFPWGPPFEPTACQAPC